jgi:xylose isomerase
LIQPDGQSHPYSNARLLNGTAQHPCVKAFSEVELHFAPTVRELLQAITRRSFSSMVSRLFGRDTMTKTVNAMKNLEVTAYILDTHFESFKELDSVYMEQRSAQVIPDHSVVEARKSQKENLTHWKTVYEEETGIVFDWIVDAVDHARANYLRGM